MLCGPLPSTDTRSRWSWAFAESRDPSGLSAGELGVTEQTGVRVKRTITDTFDVEACPLLGRPGRAFLLCRLSRSGDLDTVKGKEALGRCGNVYECHLYADGGHACTCDSGRMQPGRKCIHVISMAAVLERVKLPMPADDPHPFDHAAMCSQDVAWAVMGEGEFEPLPAYRDDD
jgi:hypothetical protein